MTWTAAEKRKEVEILRCIYLATYEYCSYNLHVSTMLARQPFGHLLGESRVLPRRTIRSCFCHSPSHGPCSMLATGDGDVRRGRGRSPSWPMRREWILLLAWLGWVAWWDV